MRQESMRKKDPAEKAIRDIRRKTRRRHSTEEKIRIVIEGLRGEESIAALCRREGIAESLYLSMLVNRVLNASKLDGYLVAFNL
jgi:transposase